MGLLVVNLLINALSFPSVDVRFTVPAPGSKSTVPAKNPVVYILLFESMVP